MAERSEPIPALVPRDETGFQFVCYADSCSGVAGAPHESTFAAVNAVVARLRPQPEFICFPGDEIRGLTAGTENAVCRAGDPATRKCYPIGGEIRVPLLYGRCTVGLFDRSEGEHE